MDDTANLADYERNALGQVVAQGLETRAQRAIAAGDAAATAEAEAAFDQVIGRLEQLGTQQEREAFPLRDAHAKAA
jgi:hypothetical protein